MRLKRNSFRHVLGALLATFALALTALAQEAPQPDFSQIKIKNFGQLDERFYRGAQPKEKDYAALQALGINTVIDLQAEPKEYEQRMVESLGMRYVNIPMIAKKYPQPEHVEAFLKLANDPETGKFYVHCAGGRHRTGVMGAVYRFTKYNWNFDQVYQEMKRFDFYTRWGHGDFKDFVEDYWSKMQSGASIAEQSK